MTIWDKSVKILLQGSDEILHTLETYAIPVNSLGDGTMTNSSELDNTINDPKNKRVIAVVAHKDEENDWEEGSVFIFKEKLVTKSYPDELEIHRILPVHGDFTITMAQVKRETLDLRASVLSSTNRPSTGLRLHINPGDAVTGNDSLDLITFDVQGLKSVLAECRRLKELADLNPETQTYSWLASYTLNHVYIPPLTSVFPHLHDTHGPLYTRLSVASAGIPGEDAKDITLIRDDWVRHRSRDECRKGRGRLHLRIGTFNVNGKIPSQNLSSWVRSSANEKEGELCLPALKKISPFSMGDKNPIDEQAKDALQSSLSSFSYSSTASTNALHSQSPTSSSFSAIPSVFTATPSSGSTEMSVPSPPASSTSTGSPIFVKSDPNIVPAVSIDQTNPSYPDMLVFGFQELDLSTEALIYATATREDAWCTAIFAALGEKGEMYEKLSSKQLVGTLIIIIVKKSLKGCFSNIMTSSVGVGIMGYMGNKGGTAVRLTFTPPKSVLPTLDSMLASNSEETSTPTPTSFKFNSQTKPPSGHDRHDIKELGSTVLTFVCSHLAAFDEMVHQRNADYHNLGKRFVFDSQSTVPNGFDVEGIPGQGASSLQQGIQERFGVFESDALFWMGDLNYRVDLPDFEVRTLLSSEHWENSNEILMKYDQLKNCIQTKQAFDIFSEHGIEHPPTYRFSPGVAVDSLGYDIKRKPAWTDRVLYVHSPLTTQVQPLSYTGHPVITMSDHRPVSAEFSLDIDLYDRHKLHATTIKLFRQVHGMEGQQERSKLRLSEDTIELGALFYNRQKTYIFTVQNSGKVPVAFRFISADLGSEVHPKWLKICPMTGLLLPKELMEITLTAFVDNDAAAELNLGSRNLNSTLILHTVMGKDLFVVVSATYYYTCFANKLSRLTQLPGPIRSLKGPDDLLEEARAINAPREVMRLVNWMMSINHSVDQMFPSPVDQEIVHRLRECLDTGEDFPYSHETKESSILVAFGETLLQLLDSLTECVVPTSLHTQCAVVNSRDEAFEVLDSFPSATVNVWISVTAFLHYIIQLSSDPEGKAQKIAAVFSPVFFGLLRNSSSSTPSMPTITPLQSQQFILYFIR